ncbi:tail length tape measure protein [Rhizobium leguminosarum]|uniref:phage tail length tape measure family protein n=1 Tax=Rhizobium leguminosarum TaxID=384 RepID=UPI000FED340B|nr:phage tail length tape measure family protein [Rhizobium leguminosarum]RWY85182.1 tail length tape measure protein [Rhizobium leguminosarum]
MSDNTDDLIISISTDQATLRRSIKRIEQDLGTLAGSVQKQFTAVGKSIDNSVSSTLQNRINSMVGIGKAASKEWTGALADQGKELERLRSKYSPLFAAQQSYLGSVKEIKSAHALGAISAKEMTSAIDKQKAAFAAQVAVIKGRNAALADTPNVNAAGRRQNLGYQAFDVGQGLASGAPLGMIAAQQGPQIAQLYAGQGGVKAALSDVSAAATMLISTFGAMPLAIGVAGAAAVAFAKMTTGSVHTADEAVKSHVATIEAIKEAYGIAGDGLGDYVKKSQVEAASAARENLKIQQEVAKEAVSDFNGTLGVLRARTGGASDIEGRFAPFTEAIRNFRKSIAEGNPDFARFRSEIEAIVATNPAGLRKFADEIINGSTAAADAERRVKAAKDVISDIGKVSSDQVVGVEALGNALKELSQIAMPSLSDAEKAAEAFRKAMDAAQGSEDRAAVQRQYDAARKRIADQNPTVADTDGRPMAVPIPGQKPVQLGEEPNKKAETAATKAANAYRDLQKAADDRIGQVKQEIDLLGKYGIEADAARFSLDLFQQAEDKGRSLSATQRAEIQKKVDLYKQYSETLLKAKLSQDLLNDMRYNSLSKEDQKITTTLRQYGLPEDLNSDQAGQIRKSLKTEDLRDDLHSFASDFKNALLNNGGDIGKAFGDAIQNAALNQISKIADRFIDQIINGIIGSVGKSGGAANGISAAITGSIGGGSSTGSAAAASKAVVSSAGSAVDLASKLFGANENTNTSSINSFLKQGGVDLNAAQTKWCAAFVNSSLEQVGIKGSGSQVANSFLDWGTKIDPSQILKGDVLVQNRGLGANQAGGHVGFATGATRFSGGQQQLEMLSGNLKDGVGKEWVSAMEVQARRATESAASLGKVAGSATDATQGLGQFGSGLNKLGGSLSSMGAGGGGWGQLSGGGGFDWASLFSPSWKPNTTFGSFLGLADGGHVKGPGGPTSDDVPAMLSNGEYVINASSTRRHRRLLDAINNGTIGHFAAGGVVAPRLTPSSAGRSYASGDNVEIKIINNNGSKVSQTKRKTSSGQTIEMVIDDMVADKMSTPGSRSRSAVQSQFGLQGGLARR